MRVKAVQVLLITIGVLIAISLAQSLYSLNTFHCVTIHNLGVCYWYHGK